MQNNAVKHAITEWLLNIDKQIELPQHIIAINFDLSQPYAVTFIGSSEYDSEDEDWACDDELEDCVGFVDIQALLTSEISWEAVQTMVATILTELMQTLPNLNIFQVDHITLGFVDGNLQVIK